MPKKKPYARIAITLPPEVLASADRLARDLDRSRSWVVAEAVRQYSANIVTDIHTPKGSAAARKRSVPYSPGSQAALGPLRIAQLQSDLDLTPTERVLAAEETLRLARLVHPPSGQQQVLTFDRPEDYLRWKQRAMVVL